MSVEQEKDKAVPEKINITDGISKEDVDRINSIFPKDKIDKNKADNYTNQLNTLIENGDKIKNKDLERNIVNAIQTCDNTVVKENYQMFEQLLNNLKILDKDLEKKP